MATLGKPGKRMDVGKLTRIGIMGAVSWALSYLEIPLFVPWMKLDISLTPILLTGFSLGFVPGVAVLVIKNILRLLTTQTFGVGEIADLCIGVAMLLPATVGYRVSHTRKGALLGMLAGVAAMIVVGVLLNRYVLLPAFMSDGFTAFMEENPNFLWLVVAPFNLIKGVLVSFITYLLYKRLAPILRQGLRR